MAKGILGKKIGMTQVFTEAGALIPVTVIEVTPNVVLQKKTVESDGYNAIQLGYADKKEKVATKPEIGHAAKANTAPKRFVKEIAGEEMLAFEVGQEVKWWMLQELLKVKVTKGLLNVTISTEGQWLTVQDTTVVLVLWVLFKLHVLNQVRKCQVVWELLLELFKI